MTYVFPAVSRLLFGQDAPYFSKIDHEYYLEQSFDPHVSRNDDLFIDVANVLANRYRSDQAKSSTATPAENVPNNENQQQTDFMTRPNLKAKQSMSSLPVPKSYVDISYQQTHPSYVHAASNYPFAAQQLPRGIPYPAISTTRVYPTCQCLPSWQYAAEFQIPNTHPYVPPSFTSKFWRPFDTDLLAGMDALRESKCEVTSTKIHVDHQNAPIETWDSDDAVESRHVRQQNDSMPKKLSHLLDAVKKLGENETTQTRGRAQKRKSCQLDDVKAPAKKRMPILPVKKCDHVFASETPLIAKAAATHRCNTCCKTFTYKSTLKTHQRVHTGEKPYRCKHCLKDFRDNSSFRRHQFTHTGARPYVCSICSMGFTQSNNLKRHVHAKHTDATAN